MTVPEAVRIELRDILWTAADRINWLSLSPTIKSRQYEQWTSDPAVGGVLARFMDRGQIRVYIKDTLLKDYARQRFGDESAPRRALGISPEAEVAQLYVKPHGRRLVDGRVICWGRADEWKSILMALHERTFGDADLRPHGVVLLRALDRYHEPHARAVVEDAAAKLCIQRVIWIDT